MNKFVLIYFCVLKFYLSSLVVATGTDYQSFDELYADGIEAYWNENWEECVYNLEESLATYKNMKDVMKNCSIQCNEFSINPSKQAFESFSFVLKKAVCLEKCEIDSIGVSGLFSRISTKVMEDFKNKKPYVHLQFAYFRAGNFAKSATAAYTYSEYDPDDQMMRDNMEYFRNHENTTEDMLINLEIQPHVKEYELGVQAFKRNDHESATHLFEKSLKHFYEAELACRAACEGEYDGGPDYLDAVTSFHLHTIDHYRHVLECYMACPNEAVRISVNKFIHNFVPRIYEHLHHSYYAMNDKVNALQCLKSYLLFFPNQTQLEEHISPREDAMKFSKMLKLQVALLKYIYQNFGIRDYDLEMLTVYKDDGTGSEANERDNTMNEETSKAESLQEQVEENVNSIQETDDVMEGYSSLEEKQLDIISSKDEYNEFVQAQSVKKLQENQPIYKDDVDITHLQGTAIGSVTVDSKYLVDITDRSSVKELPTPEGRLLFDSSVLLANSSQMAGPTRFLIDNFSAPEDCQRLIDLELSGGTSGDGYRGKSSPHTQHELFQGITVDRAITLAIQGKLPLDVAKLYYDVSERVRQQVAAYFHLDQLYFDYTHLVCRTALKGNQQLRDDNSHPIHADNCILQDDGDCLKKRPAYTWRDYSAIMYLNSDFEGGRFVMTDHTGRRVLMQVKPQCGRLVSFSAGKDCLHGVKPVTRGRRCAMALWFTQDPKHDEVMRKEAKKRLDRHLAKNEL